VVRDSDSAVLVDVNDSDGSTIEPPNPITYTFPAQSPGTALSLSFFWDDTNFDQDTFVDSFTVVGGLVSKSGYSVSWRDYSDEKANMSLTITQLTSGNVVATLALVDALLAAAQAITEGNAESSRVLFREQAEDPGRPSSESAQRERKWLVFYHDTTTDKKYRVEIPTALLTANLVAGTDLADLGATNIAAFVTAFEAVVKDPDTGLNAVAIDKIQHVGRRS